MKENSIMAASFREVRRLVEDWQPRKCKTEKDFERSLFRHLEKNLPGSEVIKQYAAGRVKGDIVVDGDILVELKDRVDTTGAVQRLLGQISIYNEKWKGKVLIVICGESQRDLLAMVEKRVESFDPGPLDIFAEKKIYLHVRKKGGEAKKSGFLLGW